jgi:hypothetical protein
MLNAIWTSCLLSRYAIGSDMMLRAVAGRQFHLLDWARYGISFTRIAYSGSSRNNDVATLEPVIAVMLLFRVEYDAEKEIPGKVLLPCYVNPS